MSDNPIEVLLVEDDEGDVELIRASLRSSPLPMHLVRVADGCQCMDYLRQVNGFETAKRPELIILDLNMPRKDGREVLAEIGRDNDLRNIPVAVLTTSESDKDIETAYRLGANCYIAKPVDFEQFSKVVNGLADFWCSIGRLPKKR